MPKHASAHLETITRLFAAQTHEEREKRAGHLFALLLAAAIAVAKYVIGLTDPGAPFTVYTLAVAAGAARGGFQTAVVATLASILFSGLAAGPASDRSAATLLFAAEGLSLALVVSLVRSRALASETARKGAEATIDDLRLRGYQQSATHVARRREWDEHRAEAAKAQAALQRAADETREQLAALESLTDPALNPLEGPSAVTELLERLRVSIRADGAALVRPGSTATGVVAAGGLQPAAGPVRINALRLAPGRVAVVHNDPARVEQLSAVPWSARVASLLVVPVMHDGQARSAIELVSERSRQVSDWDVALARIVADRLAAVVVHDRGLAA